MAYGCLTIIGRIPFRDCNASLSRSVGNGTLNRICPSSVSSSLPGSFLESFMVYSSVSRILTVT